MATMTGRAERNQKGAIIVTLSGPLICDPASTKQVSLVPDGAIPMNSITAKYDEIAGAAIIRWAEARKAKTLSIEKNLPVEKLATSSFDVAPLTGVGEAKRLQKVVLRANPWLIQVFQCVVTHEASGGRSRIKWCEDGVLEKAKRKCQTTSEE